MVGRSHIVGNPLSQLLLNENATVTVAHTHTRNLPDLCRRADILCVAIGCAEFIRGDWIKPGATVIDVGINRVADGSGKSRIVGDVNFAEAVEVAGAITPVPGGVGPMTIVCLLVNTLRAACMQAGTAAAGGVELSYSSRRRPYRARACRISRSCAPPPCRRARGRTRPRFRSPTAPRRSAI